jgi:DNA processing protein
MRGLKEDFDPEGMLACLAQKGLRALTLADEGYPEKLSEIPDPLPALFVDGEALPEGQIVALVGSRKASVAGLEAAPALGRALGGEGYAWYVGSPSG